MSISKLSFNLVLLSLTILSLFICSLLAFSREEPHYLQQDSTTLQTKIDFSRTKYFPAGIHQVDSEPQQEKHIQKAHDSLDDDDDEVVADENGLNLIEELLDTELNVRSNEFRERDRYWRSQSRWVKDKETEIDKDKDKDTDQWDDWFRYKWPSYFKHGFNPLLGIDKTHVKKTADIYTFPRLHQLTVDSLVDAIVREATVSTISTIKMMTTTTTTGVTASPESDVAPWNALGAQFKQKYKKLGMQYKYLFSAPVREDVRATVDAVVQALMRDSESGVETEKTQMVAHVADHDLESDRTNIDNTWNGAGDLDNNNNNDDDDDSAAAWGRQFKNKYMLLNMNKIEGMGAMVSVIVDSIIRKPQAGDIPSPTDPPTYWMDMGAQFKKKYKILGNAYKDMFTPPNSVSVDAAVDFVIASLIRQENSTSLLPRQDPASYFGLMGYLFKKKYEQIADEYKKNCDDAHGQYKEFHKTKKTLQGDYQTYEAFCTGYRDNKGTSTPNSFYSYSTFSFSSDATTVKLTESFDQGKNSVLTIVANTFLICVSVAAVSVLVVGMYRKYIVKNSYTKIDI